MQRLTQDLNALTAYLRRFVNAMRKTSSLTCSSQRPSTPVESRSFVDRLHEWIATVDHKRLGILYMIYALVFLMIAGIEATVIRIQLIRPHNDFVSPQVFNRLFTMHGTTMIFFVIMPFLFGFANYLMPS